MMCGSVLAAEKKNKPETPTKIKSDIIDVNRKTQVVQFIDHVEVEKDGNVMLTDKMTVIYREAAKKKKKEADEEKEKVPTENALGDPLQKKEEDLWGVKKSDKNDSKKSDKEKASSVEKIIAESHVKVFMQDSTATADTGYYDPKDETFVLEKNVVVNDGTSIANGDKFIYNLKTQKGHFVGKKTTTNLAEKVQSDSKKERVTIIVTDGGIEDRNRDSKKSKDQNKGQKNEQNSQH